MSFYTDASLVLIPSGYKDQKVYCAKPIDGSADLTFSRATNATRVNSSGLVEKVRTNLFTYSEQLDNAAWTKAVTTITANAIVAPDGTTTADKMADSDTTTAARYTYQPPASSGTIYTSSGYFKKGEYNFVTLHAFGINGAVFNLDTGVKVSQSGGVGSIESVGNGWYRCSFAFTAGGGSVFFSQSPAGNISYAGTTGSGIYAWGLQLETGDIATDYIATTSSAVSVGPVSGLPRLDYSGGASCPSLLLEPQRTNVNLNSETFGAGTGTTIVLNNTTSPDGYVNADKLVEDTSTGVHITAMGGALGGSVDSSVYSVSVFAKAAGRTRINIFDNNQAGGGYSNFDIENGVVIDGTGKIENYGNGWYRCIIFPTKDNSTTSNVQIRLIDSGTNTSYTGNGTSGVFLWGKQVEAGSYASSYIPTITAVTRVADAAYKTGISSLIGQTEGTLFAEFEHSITNISEDTRFILSDNTYNNWTFFGIESGTGLRYYMTSGGVNQLDATVTNVFPTAGKYKVAMAYQDDLLTIYVNGVQKVNNTSSTTIPSMSALLLSGKEAITSAVELVNKNVNQALVFKTRLTNAQLAELTTL